jgi:hypothetical protein
MSWLLYPTNPAPEYYAALKVWGVLDPEKNNYLRFSLSYFGLVARFFEEQAGIRLRAYETQHGGLAINWSNGYCRFLAFWLEMNGPPREEQLPPEWRGKGEDGHGLTMLIPILRYSGGIAGND